MAKPEAAVMVIHPLREAGRAELIFCSEPVASQSAVLSQPICAHSTGAEPDPRYSQVAAVTWSEYRQMEATLRALREEVEQMRANAEKEKEERKATGELREQLRQQRLELQEEAGERQWLAARVRQREAELQDSHLVQGLLAEERECNYEAEERAAGLETKVGKAEERVATLKARVEEMEQESKALCQQWSLWERSAAAAQQRLIELLPAEKRAVLERAAVQLQLVEPRKKKSGGGGGKGIG